MQEQVNKVFFGNCLDVLLTLETNSVDSIVTDAPYELGFMGKSWDNTGIANNKDMWAECLRVLKPGGHLLAFSGTRTYHRMASAIEDAGFEVRDMIEWVYGSGFPKSLNIGKKVDELQGNEREDLGIRTDIHSHGNNCRTTEVNYPTKEARLTKGTSEWEGWGTALKPAHEPICMARKPIAEKTVAENCLKYGTGGINIDESRVDYNGEIPNIGGRANHTRGDGYGFKELGDKIEANTQGRFPANLIHDNSEEVRECFPESNGRFGAVNTGNVKFSPADYGKGQKDTGGIKDSGNASRFFKSIIYQAKASKSERNKGMDDIEAKEWKQENSPNPNREERPFLPVKNNHPTVKPIALMEYLIKMVTPKGGIVLDPFAGSGSTLVAAKQNGYQYIGIEMTEEYIPIIEARLSINKD